MLQAFIHVVKDVLLSHPHSFALEEAKIHWSACHLQLVGSTAHNWWMGLIKENAVAQGVKDTYNCSGLPFVLVSLQSVNLWQVQHYKTFRCAGWVHPQLVNSTPTSTC
ncbi:hypothetical protein CROQUDRAFT_100533 [Cronartium quercuum f. sp. fusiforme G11]|uniref:Uncharacterized protein n=1 Tax=Cronartium quercuum f. sp. fusiforme G11 TaxID=708437 RepID=A0A9P6T5W2_9BASI|nr:hypothetical protein CROQUDRAFT_100533 [Cronartium quercuum f. sp. fusiforme G11]